MTLGADKTNKKPTTARKSFLVREGLVVLACAGVLIVLHTREPRYNGRSLTSWLQQYDKASVSDTKQMTEAQDAIRTIGTERSLPTLLKLITAKDGGVDNWVFKMKSKFGLKFLHWRFAALSRLYGLSGFEVLGTNAAPAVDSLTKLVKDKDKDTAMAAFQCLERIGKPAEGALCQCLTNQDWRVRLSSIDALASVTDDAETYISRVKVCLNDTNITIRVTAVRVIGSRYPQARPQVVPYLVTLLNDPHRDVRVTAGNVLKAVDPQAAADAGIK
jgi:HEAT repeat protein